MARILDELLRALSGTSVADRPEAWADWWKESEEGPRKNAPSVATFFSVPIDSLNILFALDLSGSMYTEMTLRDEHTNAVREELVLAADRLGYAEAELVKALRSLPEEARFNIVVYGEDALPALLDAMKSDDAKLLIPVAQALGRIGPPAATLVPRLEELLESPDAELEEPPPRLLCASARSRIHPDGSRRRVATRVFTDDEPPGDAGRPAIRARKPR